MVIWLEEKLTLETVKPPINQGLGSSGNFMAIMATVTIFLSTSTYLPPYLSIYMY